MSLTVALNAAKLGLLQAEQKIAIVSGNINNADRTGYTRKVFQSNYSYNGDMSLPIGGTSVHAVTDDLLVKQANQQSTLSSYATTLSTYLSTYSQTYGSTGADASTLSSNLDTMTASIAILEQTPSDDSAKAKVISSAQTVVSSLNSLSANIQDQRLQANNDIATTVNQINQNLKTVYDMNTQIATAKASGLSTADLEDTRNTALLGLSQAMGIQYFTNDQDQVQVYSAGGTSLVGMSQYGALSYSPVGQVSSSTTYPGGFAGIMYNGVDITSSLTGGTIGALVTLRDTTLPGEQAKLDGLATTLKQTVNAALNQGTVYPPMTTLTGSVAVTSATPLSGTGTLRIAVSDKSGTIQSVNTLNIASYATVGALVSALNALPGVSASVASGTLVINATSSSNGISLNPQDTNVGGIGITQFFGFNDLFTNNSAVTLNASTIQVNPQLLQDSSKLATGTLSTTAVAGGIGTTNGDASAITGLVNALNTAQSFTAAGDFSAKTSTLSAYASAIMTDSAVQASAAKNNADAASATYSYLSTNLSNETGVNVDEETANLTVLQGNYEANAQLISTIKGLFETLMSAVR